MAKAKILKTGETDIESTDIWRFSLHSDYPTQKIVSAGETTLTIQAGEKSGTKTINHSLGYAPIVMAMFEISGGRFVKVLGNTRAYISGQSMQFFAVNSSLNQIICRLTDEIAGPRETSYVSVNDVIQFRSGPRNGGVLPTPLAPNTNYYVNGIVDSEVFTVSTTLGGSTVDITDGGGTYVDVFKNITNPLIVDFSVIYSVKSTSTSVVFEVSPTLTTPYAENNIDITVYYIILYEQI